MKYPIGIQSFEKLRSNGYVYVDKTDLMYNLVQGYSCFFLSRPRRFGKSLFLSTLDAYFSGRKDLFDGLAVAEKEKEWKQYPVLHLDLNTGMYNDVNSLYGLLNVALNEWEAIYGKGDGENAPAERLGGIIKRAYQKTQKPVVVLIDEYDKPLLQSVDNDKLQDEFRMILKSFYGVLKSQDRYIRFALLTGVTKFSKVSVFSDLNNLVDISMSKEYQSVCGINENELHEYFDESVKVLAQHNHMDVPNAYAKLKENYDGYHFVSCGKDIYNPFSLLNVLNNNEFGSYWFESGTPTFLVKLLRDNNISIGDLDGKEIDAESLGNIDVMKTDPVPVIYQSGYLTIKDYDSETGLYRLGFPNKEVERGFFRFLLPFYTNVKSSEVTFDINQFIIDVKSGKPDSFLKRLSMFFADYNYELIPRHDLERHYQNVIFIVFKLMGLRVKAEYHTSHGRIDLLLMTNEYVYIFEFKPNLDADDAIGQITQTDYSVPFFADTRKVYKIGVNFSSEKRGIDSWKIMNQMQ